MVVAAEATRIYDWPKFTPQSELDWSLLHFATGVQSELRTVEEALAKPLPDNPVELDVFVTQYMDGWLPRVAALAVVAEFYLSQAKQEKWPSKEVGANGRPITTEKDREVQQEAALGYYRFVRNYLDMMVNVMRDRVRWAQSVRKQHQDAQ